MKFKEKLIELEKEMIKIKKEFLKKTIIEFKDDFMLINKVSHEIALSYGGVNNVQLFNNFMAKAMKMCEKPSFHPEIHGTIEALDEVLEEGKSLTQKEEDNKEKLN